MISYGKVEKRLTFRARTFWERHAAAEIARVTDVAARVPAYTKLSFFSLSCVTVCVPSLSWQMIVLDQKLGRGETSSVPR